MAFTIIGTLDRMHWVVLTPAGIDLYTIHNSCIFLFVL